MSSPLKTVEKACAPQRMAGVKLAIDVDTVHERLPRVVGDHRELRLVENSYIILDQFAYSGYQE